jgi:hypothetical protein
VVQGGEDLLSQHLLRDAHTDFRHCRTLFARIDEDMKVVSKIEKPRCWLTEMALKSVCWYPICAPAEL